MANMEELYAALQAADAAGNTEDAKQIANYIRQYGAGLPQEKPKKEEGDLVRGFKSYGPQTQGLLGGVQAFLGAGAKNVLGEGDVSNYLFTRAKQNLEESEKEQKKTAKKSDSLSDAYDQGIATVVTDWLPYTMGQGAANMLETIGLSVAGAGIGTLLAPGAGTAVGAAEGLVGGTLLKQGIKEGAKAILEKELKAGATKEAALTAAKEYTEAQAKKSLTEGELSALMKAGASKIGSRAGTVTQALGHGMGEVGSRAASEQMERGLPLPDLDFSRIGPAAAVHATADYIAERIGLGAFKGLSNPTKNMLLNMSRNWLTVGSKELTPELVQTAAERYGANLPLDDQKALKEYIDTAGATYGMSLLPGALGGMQTAPKQPAPAAPPGQEQAPVVQPEVQAPQGVDLSQMTRAGVSPESLMGSMAGMSNVNEQMISEQRRQQAQMMAEEEKQRKAQINEIMQTNYSSDPTVNEATKKRMLANLGFTQPAAPEMAPPQPTPAGVPGGMQSLMGSMTGTRDVNANMLAQARAQQEEQAGAEEKQRQAEIKKALNATYSSDPLQNDLKKRRVLESLGYKEPEPEKPMTPEEWNALTPEERQFEMQRMAATEAADRSRRKSKGFKGQWTPEELAAMGIEQGEKKKTAPAIKAIEHPDNIGVIGTDEQGFPIPGLLSEGAKPFASKDVANYVRKLQPMMKAVQLPNGQYVLSPKTEAELAREGKSKIHLPSTGEKGPQTAHDFIVSNGGIRFADQSKTDFLDQNPKVGNRYVFQQNGKSIAKMAELLHEAGYIAEESENAVSDILSKSLKNPQYTSEGFERVGEQELEQRRRAEEKAELESSLTAQTAEEMGYPNTPLEVAQANISYARNLGLDVDSILEQAHEDTKGQSDDAFHDRISELVRQQTGPIVENQMQAGFDFGEPAPAPVPQATTTRARPEKPLVLTPPPGFKLVKDRNEQIVLAARELAEGRITKKEYDQYVDYYMPVGLVEKPEPPMSLADMKKVLTSAQREKIDTPIAAGTHVGLRMDINALNQAKKDGIQGSVVAIHPQNKPKTPLSYSSAAHVTNATFAIRSEKSAMKVAMGEAYKEPQQTIEGSWVPGKAEDIYAKVQQLLKDPAWSQVSLDPLRHSFFYDRATMQPVVAADEVYQVGRFVLAKNVQYEERKNFMYMRDASLDAIGMVDNFAAGYAESKVVYQKGDLSLVRAWSPISGRPIYLGANTKTAKATRVDIRDDKSDTFTAAQKRLLLNQVDKIEDQEKKKHQDKPFIKFDKGGVAASANITPELKGILTDLKDLLGVKANIYIGTVDDVMNNINNYTGPHREISVIIGDKNKLGTMVRVSNGDYFIVFKNQASKIQEIETMAHELGHIHQLEVFDRADEQTKKEITDEYFNWLSNQKDKTAKELVQSLRARKVGKHNVSALEGMSASDLRAYWTKFAEWYADQVSRWATTSEKPLSVVEKFFYRLAQAMKSFYAKLRNQKYLPTTTMKKFLDSMKRDAADIENKGQLEMFMQAPVVKNQLSAQSVIEGAKTKAKKALQTRAPMEERAFDGMNPDTALEVQRIFFAPNKTIVDRLEGMKDNFFQTLAQKTVDQFRTIRDYSPIGYMQARLSTATDGALEGLLFHGHVKNVDGALDIKQGTKGLIDALQPLGHEVDRFQVWMALSREANLPDSKRSEQLRDLVGRRGEFVAGSHNGKPRAELYESVRKDLMALNRSVLKVALDSGTIDQEAYDRFASDAFYIPFYKMMEDGNIESIRAASRLTNQQFSKALKGNNDKPFGDLMENTLRNWSHILSSSMKNQAAVTIVKDAMEVDAVSPNLKAGLTLKDGKVYSMKTGEMVGDGQLVQTKIDEEGQEYQVNMTEAGNQSVKVMMEGQPVYFAVNDPMLLESIGAINFAGSQSKIVDVLRMFKNTLRFGVTASPIFKANNLIKDSIQAAGVSGLGFNFVQNVMSGLADSGKGSPVYQSALAGGGVFNYGTTLEGDRSEAVKKLIALGVKPDTILTDKEHITHALKYVWHKYEELGNKSEAANRIALYKKLRAEGKSHLEASYHARDLMDYSMQGSSGAMRFLCQVVPFLGARSQGLYKLGRDGLIPTTRVFYNTVTGKPIDQTDAQKAKAFSTVSMGVMLASMALYLAFKDDEDFKRREQWDRDYFWWFKVPGTELALRIPKPFEFGSLGTLAERTLEQIVDDSVESKVFTESLSKMVWQTFSMNPTPQFFKPMIDIYANKESFTSAPIETHGMERLSKQERKTDQTSPLAIALGGVSHAVANVFGESSELSPVQIDYLIRAYFGWLGGTAQSASQYAMMPFKDGSYPDADWTKRLSLGFVQNLPSQQSRYVTSFYQNNQLIQQAYADMRHYAAFNQMDKVQEIMEEKGDLIALQKIYDQRSKVMANVRKQILHISDPNNTTMDGAQKKDEILRLRLLMSDIAQQAEDFRINRMKEKI